MPEVYDKTAAAKSDSHLPQHITEFSVRCIPFSEKDAAMGMVPYIHSGEAMPNALAAAIPETPS